MSDMFLVCMLLVKGCQTLVMDPTSLLQQSSVNAVPHNLMVHWYLLGSGREFQDLTKIWPNFSQHIIDVWHVHSGYATCKGLSDLGNGPNKPTATIIGECSASQFDGAHWYLLGSGREFQDVTKIWPNFLQHIIDVWHVRFGYATCNGL